MKGVWIKTTKT